MIFPEKVGERQNNIQEILNTLMQLDNSILSPQKPGAKSKILDNLTENFSTNPTNEHNDDSLEGLLPCDLFSEEDDYDHEEGYSQGYDTSDEESLSSKMDDNYETLIKNLILEFSCDESPPWSPSDDKYLESWVPCDIFETQRFEEDGFEQNEKYRHGLDTSDEASLISDIDGDDNYWTFIENPTYDTLENIFENPIYDMSSC